MQIPSPIPATAVDGRLICMVMEQTSPVTLEFYNGHNETIEFYLYQSNHHPLILGFSWFVRHNPHINWVTGEIES